MIILVILFLLLMLWTVPPPCPEERFESKIPGMETIFVSIASYRDELCPVTLDSLYDNAVYPERVYVGICQQNMESVDSDCAFSLKLKKYQQNIRSVRLNYMDAKGPTYARYLCSTLWEGETYYLQIDSHSKFARGWDEKLISMIKDLKKSGVKKPLLSHYPPNYEDVNLGETNNVTTICKSFFNDRGMLSFEGAQFQDRKNLPQPNAYVAGGMMFLESKFLEEVPFDPNLPHLFVGEEILQSARFWTSGWDIFTPNENTVFHFYTREGKPKFWDHHKGSEDRDAHLKVQNMLRLSKEPIPQHLLVKNEERYGLGKERTIEEYYAYAGINLKDKKVNKSFCV